MISSQKIGAFIAYGLLCASTITLSTTAIAQSDSASAEGMSKTGNTEAEQLADELQRFNDNRASLQQGNEANTSSDSSTAKSESPRAKALAERIKRFNAHRSALGRKPVTAPDQTATSQSDNPMDKQLGQQIERFNRNYGSLKDDSAARAGAGDTEPSEPATNSTAETRELSKEVEEYNDN